MLGKRKHTHCVHGVGHGSARRETRQQLLHNNYHDALPNKPVEDQARLSFVNTAVAAPARSLRAACRPCSRGPARRPPGVTELNGRGLW
jgi:hypothetical protein